MKYLEYVEKRLKAMYMGAYSNEYSEKAKSLPHYFGRVLTAEEHSKMSEMDFDVYFQNEQALFKWYFSYLENEKKLWIASVVASLIRGGQAKHILSFGAGPSVIELLIKRMYQDDVDIIVTDYDSYIVDRVKNIFTEIKVENFDFYKDDPRDIILKYKIDTVLMIGSACSMDNNTYLGFLKFIRNSRVKNILTFEAGIVNDIFRFKYPLGIILKSAYLFFFKRDEFDKRAKDLEENTTYHAFIRTKRQLKKIYKASGFKEEYIGNKNIRFLSYTNAYLLR